MKKNILHMIGPLGIGGAELLLQNTVNSLSSEYNNFLVYLNFNDFPTSSFCNVKLIKLDFDKKIDLPKVVLKLRKVIIENKIDIVHSHLLWPTFIARLACPKDVKLLFSVHSLLSEDAFKSNSISFYLEKMTYTSRQVGLFVSEIARQDYDKFIGLKGQSYVLHNFISDEFFQVSTNRVNLISPDRPIRFVAIGKLKEAKNYPYLIRAFKLLKNDNVSLDIYGGGHLRGALQAEIDSAGLSNVKLKGVATNIPELLKNYDIFVLSSGHEGFGLAAVEGMACGLPCFLSDIPVFREVTEGNAIFFDLKSEQDFVAKLQSALNAPKELKLLAEKGLEVANKFNRKNYIRELKAIYNRI